MIFSILVLWSVIGGMIFIQTVWFIDDCLTKKHIPILILWGPVLLTVIALGLLVEALVYTEKNGVSVKRSDWKYIKEPTHELVEYILNNWRKFDVVGHSVYDKYTGISCNYECADFSMKGVDYFNKYEQEYIKKICKNLHDRVYWRFKNIQNIKKDREKQQAREDLAKKLGDLK